MFGRRILSTPRVLARFSSTTTVVPPHPPTSTTPAFATETATSDYPQAPNHPGLWSENQRPRPTPATGPRFEQTAMQLQPQPLSAMDLIAREPIRLSQTRIAACDGGAYRSFHSRFFPALPPSLPCRPVSPAAQHRAYPDSERLLTPRFRIGQVAGHSVTLKSLSISYAHDFPVFPSLFSLTPGVFLFCKPTG